MDGLLAIYIEINSPGDLKKKKKKNTARCAFYTKEILKIRSNAFFKEVLVKKRKGCDFVRV